VDSESILWREFKEALEKQGSTASPVIYAIDRALVTAVSNTPTDNDQIIKAPRDNNLYRVIVTEQMTFYNGRLNVHMWFIRFLNRDWYGAKDTTTLLSFVLVAAKYRFLFLEQESELSLDAFRSEKDAKIFQAKVHRMLRETILIEEESRALGLDTSEALVLITGGNAELAKVGADLKAYQETRGAMRTAATKIVAVGVDDPAFPSIRDEWINALQAFLESSGNINSTYTTTALANLIRHFQPISSGAEQVSKGLRHAPRGGRNHSVGFSVDHP